MTDFDPQGLYADLTSAGEELIGYLESLSDEAFASTTDEEGWPIGVVAHHIAMGAQFCTELVIHVAEGGEISWTMDFIDDANAQHAAVFADVSKEEALEALRARLPEAAERIAKLTGEQLSRPVDKPMEYEGDHLHSAGEVTQRMLVNHIRNHLASVRKAVSEGVGA
jgi:DinB family protein